MIFLLSNVHAVDGWGVVVGHVVPEDRVGGSITVQGKVDDTSRVIMHI